jgi:adenylate cyclase
MVDRDSSTTTLINRFRARKLPRFMKPAISFADADRDSRETLRLKHLFIAVLWISIPTSTLTGLQLMTNGHTMAFMSVVFLVLLTIGVLIWMRFRRGSFPAVMHVVAAGSMATSSSLLILYGGFLESGANAMWGFVAVLGAIVIFEDYRAIIWLGIFAMVVTVSAFAASRFDATYTLPNAESQAVFNLLLILSFVFAVLFYYVRQRSRLQMQSEALLRNILPDEVAERLKTSTERIADEYESASILFADVAGFTPMSAGMEPVELVTLLDIVFSDFDTLVEERDLEKIKTIGDAYMVAAGVPVPREDHARAICDLALAMQEHVESRQFRGHDLQFRIGVNSGPVVAGIIGRHKFSYDLWGDAVNTASRMESLADPGRIQVTERTCDLIQDDFICEPAGTIDVKGKGRMPVWHLKGRRDTDGIGTAKEKISKSPA